MRRKEIGMQRIEISENGLNLVFEKGADGVLKLLHFSVLPFDERNLLGRENAQTHAWEADTSCYHMLELMVTGQDRPGERHGNKYIGTCPGVRMQLTDFTDTRNADGRKLEIRMRDEICGLETVSHMQFYDGVRTVRCWTDVKNVGTEPQGLEYVSSFALRGICKEGTLPTDAKMRVWYPHNGWQREIQWEQYTFPQLGLADCQRDESRRSSKVIGATNVGNWSCKEYLPMGLLENTETHSLLFWQIEHNGSWHWEISDQTGEMYLQLSGPSEIESQWWKNLQPGETFTTVPVCVGSTLGKFDDAMAELTMYRRRIRRKNADNEKLAVIFNDYMNCLWADPTTEKELPLIDAAQKAGCEYYCVDAGWYAPGYWWDNVGEWLPCRQRFPNGLEEVMDYIRSKGMIPGVWLEIEVMGIHCPKAARVHPDWFFTRHGKTVHDRSRWQLDFRNPEVIAHANEVIDRLIRDYHVGYIKMDYNIEPGVGTEWQADSFGDGLLGHQRAYLQWIDDVFRRYPDLIIENCASGGQRMDYAMLSRHSIQSTSDQGDYLQFASIAANAPSALTPEQSAVWSYPMPHTSKEEAIFNMCNALMQRVHQSGHLAEIPDDQFALVQEALAYYKTIRADIARALPFWPLGPSHFRDTKISLGLRTPHKAYVTVWYRHTGLVSTNLPINFLKGNTAVKVRCAYPANEAVPCAFDPQTGILHVQLPAAVCARIFELEY